MKYYAGTSGWSFDDWKGNFYPKGYYTNSKHLGYYSTQFNSTEINATFYRFMKDKIVQGWYDKTTKDFLFAVKLHRYFTHTKRLHLDAQAQERMNWFVRQTEVLGEKAGPVLVQLPPGLKKDTGLLREWFEGAPEYRYAIEFRNGSWMDDSVFQILADNNAAFVFSQTPKWPSEMLVTTDFGYLRFHGPKEFAMSKYSEEDLKAYAARIKKLTDKANTFYIYFNNSYQAYAVQNAQSLLQYLREEQQS